jgi:hypothetical protein
VYSQDITRHQSGVGEKAVKLQIQSLAVCYKFEIYVIEVRGETTSNLQSDVPHRRRPNVLV